MKFSLFGINWKNIKWPTLNLWRNIENYINSKLSKLFRPITELIKEHDINITSDEKLFDWNKSKKDIHSFIRSTCGHLRFFFTYIVLLIIALQRDGFSYSKLKKTLVDQYKLYKENYNVDIRISSTVSIATIGIILSISAIVYYSLKIKHGISREIASNAPPSPINVRSKYYKVGDKIFSIDRIYIPRNLSYDIYGKLSKTTIKVYVETSNRYTRIFFHNNHQMVIDRINTSMETMEKVFPLTQDGKIVIKEKIERELNDLIMKNKIEGKINNVFISEIISN